MIVLVRDAEPEVEDKDKFVWPSDREFPRLSPAGELIALELGQTLSDVNFDHAFCSTTSLSMRTCKLILSANHNWAPGRAPKYLGDFYPRCLGNLGGRTYRETMEEFPRRKWLEWDRDYFKAPPGGESLASVDARVEPAWETLILPNSYGFENALVVADETVIRVLMGRLNHVEERDVPALRVEVGVPYFFYPERADV